MNEIYETGMLIFCRLVTTEVITYKSYKQEFMELTLKQKIAILFALKNMMLADGVVDSHEMDFINKVCQMMKVGQAEFDAAVQMSETEAKSIFQTMTQEHKNLLSYLLQDMARADGHVDDCEKTYWTKLNGELKFTNLASI